MLKIVTNVKNNGTYNTFHEPLSQEWIDERYWSLALICHANQNNENLHNFDSELYWNDVAASYPVGCIDKSRNIPGLKNVTYTNRKPLSEIIILESSDTLQNWYLTKG